MNNYFPIGYQPYQMQAQQMPLPSNQTQSNSIIWVQGEAGAKSYLVAPNNTVTLWDTESQTIYVKSADASGMPSMKVLDYTMRGAQEQNIPPQNGFATKDDYEALKDEIVRLKERVEALGKE